MDDFNLLELAWLFLFVVLVVFGSMSAISIGLILFGVAADALLALWDGLARWWRGKDE